jgi:hypothetical protein
MNLKVRVRNLLRDLDRPGLVTLLGQDRKVVPSLNRLLFDDDPLIRWRAVTGLGWVAAHDPYALENVIGRLIYTMNDDSGQIGWMSPQALGEIAAVDPDLVEDFFRIVINSINVPDFSAGVCWAIGRVAPVRRDMVEDTGPMLAKMVLDSRPLVRAEALRALGSLNWPPAKEILALQRTDPAPVTVYKNEQLVETTVGDVAREALEQAG